MGGWHAIADVTVLVVNVLLANAVPGEDVIWRGEIFRLGDGRELLPFVFVKLRHRMRMTLRLRLTPTFAFRQGALDGQRHTQYVRNP